MVHVRRDRRFPPEPPHPVRVVCKVGVQDLERDDPATKGRVPCLVHRPESATAQPLDDLEIAEPSRRRICLGHRAGRPRCRHASTGHPCPGGKSVDAEQPVSVPIAQSGYRGGTRRGTDNRSDPHFLLITISGSAHERWGSGAGVRSRTPESQSSDRSVAPRPGGGRMIHPNDLPDPVETDPVGRPTRGVARSDLSGIAVVGCGSLKSGTGKGSAPDIRPPVRRQSRTCGGQADLHLRHRPRRPVRKIG